jgi:hypothetical protein
LKHGQEGVEIGSDAEIKWAAHLLQVNLPVVLSMVVVVVVVIVVVASCVA